jgi:4-amino-4-deoxy-L-arabinose transferase-like glycosyltransferase
MTKQGKYIIWAGLTLAAITAMCFISPIPQDPHYHTFADQRAMLGIPNFMDVISNTPFLIVGTYGLFTLGKHSAPRPLQVMYGVLFTGILLTGIGSAYYHWMPGNHRLVWDRLPMTIVFMAFLSATISERVSMRAGYLSLIPLLLVGIASVLYWHYTEELGRGDLRFYAFVQFYPMIFIPLIMLLFRPLVPDPGVRQLVWVILLYAIAKVCERFDDQVFSATSFISGHSLKHIFAGSATFFIAIMFTKRYAIPTHAQRS